jgi:hypothetical protein
MLRTLFTSLAAGLLTAFLCTATSQAADDNKCTIAVKNDNEVVKACKEGGIKKAKTIMKKMQKDAKAKGVKHDCDDCHKDEANANWTLNKDAEEKFKKMLAAIKV